MTPPPLYIVAEISKNWVNGREQVPGTGLVAEKFEDILNVNAARGYRLVQFQLHRLLIAPDAMNETLVAVFLHQDPYASKD